VQGEVNPAKILYMNTPKTKEPFTKDPKLEKKIMDCKLAFTKWELDKIKKDQVNPAKIRWNRLSLWDKLTLAVLLCYVIVGGVWFAQNNMSDTKGIEYLDTPIEDFNTVNPFKLTFRDDRSSIVIECKLGIEVCKYV